MSCWPQDVADKCVWTICGKPDTDPEKLRSCEHLGVEQRVLTLKGSCELTERRRHERHRKRVKTSLKAFDMSLPSSRDVVQQRFRSLRSG